MGSTKMTVWVPEELQEQFDTVHEADLETLLLARALDCWERERQAHQARLAAELDDMEANMQRAVEYRAWSAAFSCWGKVPVR